MLYFVDDDGRHHLPIVETPFLHGKKCFAIARVFRFV